MFQSRPRIFTLLGVCIAILSMAVLLPNAQDIPYYEAYDAPAVGVPDGYRGFEGSYDYPAPPAPSEVYPWTESLDGNPITVDSAEAYIAIVKDYISADMIDLLGDNRTDSAETNWNPAEAGWYNEPWLSQLRDGIHGAYMGSNCFAPVLFRTSNLKAPYATYVLVFYNDIAARSLSRVWAQNPNSPQLLDEEGFNNTQFDEGSIIVKAAFTTATADTWEPMENALSWDIFTYAIENSMDCSTSNPATTPSTFSVNFFQFDIIVKDSTAAPDTTWVFSTLSYDKDLQVQDGLSSPAEAWAKMGILGVMWGNDPEATNPNDILVENWINPNAPFYATETLGWAGRLSGPNDGAVVNAPYYICTGDGCNPETPCAAPSECSFVDGSGDNLAMSSCMGCHGTAQYPMPSFLLPVPSGNPKSTGGPANPPIYNGQMVFYEPGSDEWMTWFQDRSGTEPQNPLNPYVIVATDYDMNLPFKVLPQWAAQICIQQGNPEDDSTCNRLNEISSTRPLEEVLAQTNYRGFAIPGH